MRQKDKARLMGTRNYIILLLKFQLGWTWSSWCLYCLARILRRSWRKGTAFRQASRPQGYGTCSKPKKYRMKQSWRQTSMQVLNSSVARPWKLEQNTSGQTSRQSCCSLLPTEPSSGFGSASSVVCSLPFCPLSRVVCWISPRLVAIN